MSTNKFLKQITVAKKKKTCYWKSKTILQPKGPQTVAPKTPSQGLKTQKFFLFVVSCLPTVGAFGLPPPAQIPLPSTLVRNNGSEVTSLDPPLAVNTADFSVLIDLFDTLTDIDGSGALVPCAAKSWRSISPTQWEFTLRPKMVWSNGDPVVAEDFVRGWRRLMDPKTASPYAGMFGDSLFNGGQVVAGTLGPQHLGVVATTPSTLLVSTPLPTPHLPSILAMRSFSPIHKNSVETCPQGCFKPGRIVTNGPYRLVSWVPNDKIVLQKNPSHWDKKNGTIPRVIYLPISDAKSEFKMFQAGELHWTQGIPPGSFETLKKTHTHELRSRPILGLEFYTFNTSHPRLRDPRVRRALSLAIDRHTLTKKVLADGSQPATMVYPRGISGLGPVAPPWAHWPMEKRVREARALLKAAGFSFSEPLEILYDANDAHKKVAQAVAIQWKQTLGLKAILKNMERSVLNARKQKKDFMVARDGWVADFNDITTFLNLYVCSSPQNNSGVCLTEAEERFYKAAMKAKSPGERKELLTRFVESVQDSQPIAPLYHHRLAHLVKDTVGGYSEKSFSDFSPTKYYFFKVKDGQNSGDYPRKK